ncbi:hypothetical protein BJ944DRAFT_125305 [Cunninghamella echinulata]|nr:hypothetical protein BJ944DRAFT_125305 [Cunninghamella echinulata]
MNNNVIFAGDLVCNNEDIKWQSQQQNLKDLYLVGNNNSESSTCGKFNVNYEVESIVPLHAVKLYTLTQIRFRAFTKSIVLKDYFIQVFNPTLFTDQSKYAIVLSIKRTEDKMDNPFNEKELSYPLETKSYILLYGQKIKDYNNTLFHIYGQFIRNQLDYMNLYGFSTHIINNSINTKAVKDSNIQIDKFLIQKYRSDIPLLKKHQKLSPSDNNSNNDLLEKSMNKLKKLDELREEVRKQRPERTLVVTKRKISSLRRSNSNIPFLPPPPPPSSSTSSSSQSKQQAVLSLSHSSSQQSILSIDKLSSSSSSSSYSAYHDNNKKQLKSAIWSKLLFLGHDKKAEDTKLFYHSIYQSIQFVTRKTFKCAPLDSQLMNQLIDKHIQFYDSLDMDTVDDPIQ